MIIQPNDKKSLPIDKLEIERKNTSKIFKDSKFRPENIPHRKVFMPVVKKDTEKTKDIFGDKSEISKREIYYSLLKDPEFIKQAYKEGKKPWQLAKEITENFLKNFGGSINRSEAKRQINYYDYWKIIQQQREGNITSEKSRKIKQEKQERDLLKKKFGV